MPCWTLFLLTFLIFQEIHEAHSKKTEKGCIFGGKLGKLNSDPPMHLDIFVDMPFQCSGMISHWIFFATRVGKFSVGIWRQKGEKEYELIAKRELESTRKNKEQDLWEKMEERILVKEGDLIGIHYDADTREALKDKGVIPFELDKGESNVDVGQHRYSRVLKRKDKWDEILETGVVVTGELKEPGRFPALRIEVEPHSIRLQHPFTVGRFEGGIVEVFVHGSWGPVCDTRSQDEQEKAWGDMICKMMNRNYQFVGTTVQQGFIPHTDIKVSLANPTCLGEDLDDCQVVDPPPCNVSEELTIDCIFGDLSFNDVILG